MQTIPIKLLNSLIKIAQRKHKIPKSSSFPKVFFQNFEVDQTLKSKYSQRGMLGVEKVVRGEYLERGKSAVNFYIVFDLYKDDSMLIITDFGLILMSILFTQTIPCIKNVNFL